MNFATVNVMLGKSFLLNCQIFFVTLLFSLPLGLLISFGSMSRVKPLSWLSRLYVYLMRSTPLMLQLAVVFYLPGFLNPGHGLSRMTAACLAFVLNYAAYFSEIFRGGIQGIPKGQHPAAGRAPRSSGGHPAGWARERRNGGAESPGSLS